MLSRRLKQLYYINSVMHLLKYPQKIHIVNTDANMQINSSYY